MSSSASRGIGGVTIGIVIIGASAVVTWQMVRWSDRTDPGERLDAGAERKI